MTTNAITDPFEDEPEAAPEPEKKKSRAKKANNSEPKPKRGRKKAEPKPESESEPKEVLDQPRSAGKLELGIGDPGAGSPIPFWLRQQGYQPKVWESHAGFRRSVARADGHPPKEKIVIAEGIGFLLKSIRGLDCDCPHHGAREGAMRCGHSSRYCFDCGHTVRFLFDGVPSHCEEAETNNQKGESLYERE